MGPGKGKKTRNSEEKKPANRTSRGPSPWQRKKNPEFERKKTRESYFQRARAIQPTNRRAWRAQKTDTSPWPRKKNPEFERKKNPRIVIPEGQGHPTNQPTGLARPEDRHHGR